MAAEEEIDEFLDEEQLDAIVIPGQENTMAVSCCLLGSSRWASIPPPPYNFLAAAAQVAKRAYRHRQISFV